MSQTFGWFADTCENCIVTTLDLYPLSKCYVSLRNGLVQFIKCQDHPAHFPLTFQLRLALEWKFIALLDFLSTMRWLDVIPMFCGFTLIGQHQ